MKKIPLVLIALGLFLTGTALHASPVITSLSENFDALTAQLDVGSAGDFRTIGGSNVDIVGAKNGWGWLCAKPESGNCIDLGGTGGNPVGVLQSNSEFAAGSYDLSFDLIGSQRGDTTSTQVTFGNYSTDFTLASNDDTDGIVTNVFVTLSSPGYLTFTDLSPADNIGSLLDNVDVTPVAATPEPSSLYLLGTGLVVLAGFARLKFAVRNS